MIVSHLILIGDIVDPVDQEGQELGGCDASPSEPITDFNILIIIIKGLIIYTDSLECVDDGLLDLFHVSHLLSRCSIHHAIDYVNRAI